jgi:hypothetical protein
MYSRATRGALPWGSERGDAVARDAKLDANKPFRILPPDRSC